MFQNVPKRSHPEWFITGSLSEITLILTEIPSYDQLKNINSVIVSLGADYESDTKLTYITDYTTYDDPTNLQVVPAADYEGDKEPGTRPQNDKRPAVFRRRPMCRRVLHFSMQLANSNMDEDLALVSAEILFNRQGRLR